MHDPHTGDKKAQYEHRDGHVVKGGYTLKEADGTTRVVEYIAGPHSGFNAVVKRLGHAHHPAHYGIGGQGGFGGGYGGQGGLIGGQGGYIGGQGGFGGYGGGQGGLGGSSYVGVTHFGYGQ